jgi:hypothetical protein
MITEYEVYSDERRVSESGQRYLFLGGVVCTQTGRDRLLKSLDDVRNRYQRQSEMKWTKVSISYLEFYKAWVDVFFDDPFSRFSILNIDLSSRDWNSFTPRPGHRASLDDRLASAFYQYLLVTFGPLQETKRWSVYPDAGLFSCDTVLDRVEILFNKTYKRAFGPQRSRIIRLARARNSHRTDLIQLADVLLGALSFRLLCTQPDSPARRQLACYCSERLDRVPRTRRGLERLTSKEWVPPDRFEYT